MDRRLTRTKLDALSSFLIAGSYSRWLVRRAYRVYWCRMPALVALGVGVLATALYVRSKAMKRDRSIKTTAPSTR